MNIKRVKRICDVRGCKNTDTYSISLTREVGNSVIICKACLGKALGAIDECKEEPSGRTHHSTAPTLFYNQAIKTQEKDDAINIVIEEDSESVEAESIKESSSQKEKFVCEICGKEFDSKRGLNAHKKTHKEESAE